MKVYGCPQTLPAPEFDLDYKKQEAAEQEHQEKLKQWLINNGYTNKHTGEIYRTRAGDGCAQYMIADGNPSCLVHLPYGDAWQAPDVEFLSKKEILKRIKEFAKNVSPRSTTPPLH